MTESDSGRILVLGATGKVGSALLQRLENRGVPVNAATRLPDKAVAARPTTQWVHFDLEQPSTFAPALADVSRVFLIARPGDDSPQDLTIPFIDAIKNAGVNHVVNLTAMGTEMRPDFGLFVVEKALETSGLSFTHLRPNFFMQFFTSGLALFQIKNLRQIRVPAGDAALTFIDVNDIADVAVEALLDASHRRKAYTLTGGEPLSHAEVAACISRAASKTIEYVALDEEQARQEIIGAGLPSALADRLISFYRIVRTGAGAFVSSAVKDVLARAPRTFAEFAETNFSSCSS
jgi:uncharacterized protein YbjT (DUF2867 family)